MSLHWVGLVASIETVALTLHLSGLQGKSSALLPRTNRVFHAMWTRDPVMPRELVPVEQCKDSF